MDWTYRLTHLGLTFGLIWNCIKGGKSTASRIISIVLWSVLMIVMLYVLSLWLSVPTYTHYIYLDRLFSERPPLEYQFRNHKDDYYVSANYRLSLSSGVSAFKNTETTRFRERVYFEHEKKAPALEQHYKKRQNWASIELHSCNPQSINDVVSGEIAQIVNDECKKYDMTFNDFKYGYYFLHRYTEDISQYGIKENKIKATNSELDTLHRYLSVSKGIEIDRRTNEISDKSFVLDKDMPKIPNVKFGGEIQHIDLSNIGYGVYDVCLRTKNQHVLTNLWYSLFKMYDLTKARYVLYLNTNAMDSVYYTIEFEEGVSFSEINIPPVHKDMNTLQFVGADFESQRKLAGGIKFYIEYLESSNLQTIRESILFGLLTIPLTLIIKNVWMLIINRTNNNQENQGKEQTIKSVVNSSSRKRRKAKK